MKKNNKNIILLGLLIVGILCVFAGCGKNSKKNDEAQKKENMETEAISTNTATGVSVEVTELYQSQSLMLEMLVNTDCVIDDADDTLTVMTKNEFAYVGVSFIPGIQNLGQTAVLIPTLLQENYKAVPGAIEDSSLLGARAKQCTYTVTDEDGKVVRGIFAAAVINQSLYLMDMAFSDECTQSDMELIINVFTSMNVLKPVSVNTEEKTANYVSQYPEAPVSKAAKKTYKPVTEWVYLPYYYYGSDSDYDYGGYDSSFYEPDWDYYSEDDWWSWSWDEDEDWYFYDEYADWYDEGYYDSYEDYYHDDYDPYSDPGDYYDYYDDYYYDDYDPYSDPGDSYEEYSDPGDTYDDYEEYSDPGDTYDDYEEYSDPGDTYDDYEEYSDPGDMYDEYGDVN